MIVQFLTPDEVISLAFFCVISVLFLGTLVSTRLRGKNEFWEKNLKNSLVKGKIEGASISATELSELIATLPEKIAVSLPGILLVIGLLGTFLGIGIAITNGAEALANPEDDMTGMKQMLEGLGIKFRTSVYGIIAFILFRVCHGWLGNESKRLMWSVKIIDDHRSQFLEEENRIQDSRIGRIEEAIGNLGKNFSESFAKEISSVAGIIQSNFTSVTGKINDLNVVTQKSMDSNERASEKSIEASQSISQSVALLSTEVVKMSETSETMNAATDKIAAAATDLSIHINNFGPMVADTMGKIQNAFIASVAESSEKMSSHMTDASGEMKKAIETMASQINVTNEKIRESVNQLSASSIETQKNAEAVLKEMNTGLASSIADSSTKIAEQSKSASDAIKCAIESMTGQIEDSNNKIRDTVTQLSESSVKSQGGVQDVLEKMNESISKSEGNSERSRQTIERALLSLQEVSNQNERQMKDIASSIKQNLKDIGQDSISVSTSSKEIKEALKEIHGSLGTFFETVPGALEESYLRAMPIVSDSIKKLSDDMNSLHGPINGVADKVAQIEFVHKEKMDNLAEQFSRHTGDLIQCLTAANKAEVRELN